MRVLDVGVDSRRVLRHVLSTTVLYEEEGAEYAEDGNGRANGKDDRNAVRDRQRLEPV